MAKNLAEKALDSVVSHQVDLMRYSESVRREVLGLLHLLSSDLEDLIKNEDLSGTASVFQQKKYRALFAQTKDTITSAYGSMDETLSDEILDLTKVEHGFATGMIEDLFQGAIQSTVLTPKDLETIASNILIEGSPAKSWWSKQATDLNQRFASQVRLGVAAGESNDQIVNRIVGGKTGRGVVVKVDGEAKTIPEYSKGVMDISRRDATTLVRTAVQTVSNTVLEETYRDNDDVVKGRQALATLDRRTSEICRARDGGAWDWKGDPLPESPVQSKFPGRPPYHFACRTILIPVTYSWEELLKKAGSSAKLAPILDLPESTRASMDGQVAGRTTYEDWLKSKSEAFQKDVLGETKWSMWKKGNLTMAEIVDPSGRPLSIDELEKKVGE